MNTDTGRVYLPEEYEKRTKREVLDEHQAEFEEAQRLGKIVEVSERVALQQLAGQEAEARRARRKAQKAARKQNRRK